jgi:5-methyltetrahydrofolate--homocysteine methyltransferase
MSFPRLKGRLLEGRPLVVASDICASFRARGVSLDSPGAIGQLLRERPDDVLRHYRAEVECRVDIVTALTADTTPRALAEVGMQHRASQLTSRAVELALEVAVGSAKPVAVAGILGSDMVSPMAADRLHEELTEHAARIAAAGCELLITRGQGSRLSLMAAVVAAARTELPTWAVVECTPEGDSITGSPIGELLSALHDAGASVVLFEVPRADVGLRDLERCATALENSSLIAGVLLAAGDEALPGFNDPDSDPDRWVDGALDLSIGGARVIGGGAGTTEEHTRALALALGSLHPSIPHPPSTPAFDREPSGGW